MAKKKYLSLDRLKEYDVKIKSLITESTNTQIMKGATSTTAGSSGLVPPPAAGDQDKFLKGNGSWTVVPAAPVLSVNSKIGNVVLSAADVGADISGSSSSALIDAKSYTDVKIAGLINGAPDTLDTLKEIADAMADNESVVDALSKSIGNKADASALTSHTSNKSNPHGVTVSQLGLTANVTELNFVHGVTSAIQTQLNNKANLSHEHSAADITSGILPITRGGTGSATAAGILSNIGITATAVELNKLDGVTTTGTQFNYMNTVTSNVQTQLNGKAPINHDHTYMKVADTRSVNPAPKDTDFRKYAVSFDLKQVSIVNSPNGFSGNYLGLMSFAPWAETSGGHGYQMAYGYGATSVPKLAIRAADLSATSWGSWYKIYTSADKPTLAELGASATSHNHDAGNITTGIIGLERGGTGANSAAGALIKLGVNATAAQLNFCSGVTSNIQAQLNSKSASNHTHAYLPLSGGTLTGQLTANARIRSTSLGGGWTGGMNINNAALGITTKNTNGSYHPIIAGQTYNSHFWNIGTITDTVGFYGFKSGRTDNGIDWQFAINVTNGAVKSTGTIVAPTFIGNLDGNAATATKLGTATKGSSIQPVYLSGGTATPCSYTISKSVPSAAVFKDTTYTLTDDGAGNVTLTATTSGI